MNSTAQLDPLRRLYLACAEKAESLPESAFLLWTRLGLFCGLSLILCPVAFKALRSWHPFPQEFHYLLVTLVELTLVGASLFAASALPLEYWSFPREARLPALVLASLLLATTPAILPFFLSSKAGIQSRLRWGSYGLLLLFLATTFFLS